jgi:hypothetical protein
MAAHGSGSQSEAIVPSATRGPLDSARTATAAEERARDGGESFVQSFEALLPKFGRRFARSPEDDSLTSFVKEQMKRAGRPWHDAYKFIISKQAGHWVVSVVDMEAVREGRRANTAATYHISDEGGLHVLYLEAGI